MRRAAAGLQRPFHPSHPGGRVLAGEMQAPLRPRRSPASWRTSGRDERRRTRPATMGRAPSGRRCPSTKLRSDLRKRRATRLDAERSARRLRSHARHRRARSRRRRSRRGCRRGGQIVRAIPHFGRLIGPRRPCQSRVLPEARPGLQQKARRREIGKRTRSRSFLAARERRPNVDPSQRRKRDGENHVAAADTSPGVRSRDSRARTASRRLVDSRRPPSCIGRCRRAPPPSLAGAGPCRLDLEELIGVLQQRELPQHVQRRELPSSLRRASSA